MIQKQIPIIFLLLLNHVTAVNAQDILLPPTPKSTPPPPTTEEDYYKRLDRKRQQRQDKIKKENPQKTPQEKRDEELFNESQKERAYDFFLQLNLLYPQVSASGEFEKFTTELTTHFSGGFEWNKLSNNKSKIYIGGRIASFSGTGIVEKVPARYSYMYFGPALIWSKIIPKKEIKKKRRPAAEVGFTPLPAQKNAWMLMGGVAARSTQISSDTPADGLPGEWRAEKDPQRKVSLWLEAQHHTIYFGALSMQFIAGLQASDKKNFVWAGIGATTWN